ncbi:MAG: FAD-binding oxidoreductase [Anaerolineales bacterium]|jgi:alkyldihydroxyacetonephosphate synthase
MRRWNGWGDQTIDYPLPPSAADYLETRIGPGDPKLDATLESVLSTVPDSRLPPHPLIQTDPLERLCHARGQSLPDWVALRSGRIEGFPDGVSYPTNDLEVRSLLEDAKKMDFRVIPYGGGSSVVGHLTPPADGPPVLSMDLGQLNKLIELDPTNQLATFDAGACGPDLEAQLRPHGYLLGHYPQSFEYSTLGGWIATRSTGQQSYYYGRIEALFAGGHVETPIGPLDLPPFPASAAGPDVRQLILGSEGRLGVITRAILRVRPIPERESFQAIFFRDWESGAAAVRAIAQAGVGVSMLRLSDAQETETTLALSGKERLVSLADPGLRLLGFGPQRCLLIFGVTGSRHATTEALRMTTSIARGHRGLHVGATIGKIWHKSRFRTPYLRNTLWEQGYALDTVETAVPWRSVLPLAEALRAAASEGLASSGERVLGFVHLSHMYRSGASIYLTFLYRRAADPEETLQRWRTLKAAASQAIVSHGGTISHQHGVGIDHLPYLKSEKGEVGLEALEGARRLLDPKGLMNPGKLLEGS